MDIWLVVDDFEIGSVKDKSIKELWYNEKFNTLRKAHLQNNLKGTICEACINGGCN